MKTAKEIRPKMPRLARLCEKFGVPLEYRETRQMIIRFAAVDIYRERPDDNKSIIRRFLALGWIEPDKALTQCSGMKWMVTDEGQDASIGYQAVELEIKTWKENYGSLRSA